MNQSKTNILEKLETFDIRELRRRLLETRH